MRVGMVGLGNIGAPVARNLVADSHTVTVFDTDVSRARSVAGATAATGVAELAESSEVTLLSLPAPEIVRGVAQEWARRAPAGAVLVDLSTNDPEVVRGLGKHLATSGHHFVEAPLTGGASGAARRTLVFMIGGDDDAVARVIPVLSPLSRATFHLGPLGLGNTMKLVNSLVAFTATWSSLEALSLAAKAGIPLPQAVEVLRTGGATNFYLERMVEGIDDREGPPMFALGMAAKDAALIVDTGRTLGVPTPTAAAVGSVLVEAVATGLGEEDWARLVEVAERLGDVTLRWNG